MSSIVVNLPSYSDPFLLGQPLLDANRLPMLVAGVAGVVGFNAFAYFRQKYEQDAFGQRPERNWPLSTNGIIGVDLENTDSIKRFIHQNGIRSILNCGGSCALKSCELDAEMAHRVNVDAVQSLLNAISDTDIRLTHLSIDLVYSGTRGGGHLESDAVDPVTVYGKTMVQAENLILDQRPKSAILRISLPMGVSFNGHAGAVDWIQARFAKNKPATLYFDEIRTPTYVDCLNEVIEQALASDFSGIFHAGGPRTLSLYEIAQIVNRVGGYDPKLLEGCYRIQAGPIPPRAGDVTMNSSKLTKQLGRTPFVSWPDTPEFVPNNREWHYERNGFKGCPEMIARKLYARRPPEPTQSKG